MNQETKMVDKKYVFHTIDSIKELFAKYEYILVSTEYVPGVKLQFICDKNHEGSMTIGGFVKGNRCIKCGIETIRNLNKTPYLIILNLESINVQNVNPKKW